LTLAVTPAETTGLAVTPAETTGLAVTPAETTGLAVTPVETKGDLAAFIALPRRLYAGMPGFVPPLDLERRSLLHPKASTFFQAGRARYFLARRDGQWVGRISAQIDPVATTAWQQPIGLFGALDAVDDPAVIAALLDAATSWLRAQGMQRVRGPYMLNANGESGLMISGQTARPMMMMPWHPAYLGPRLEALGWTKAMDLLAYDLQITPALASAHRVYRSRPPRGGLTIRKMRPKQMAEDAELLRTVYNDAWSENWGFVPLTEAEMKGMIKELRPILRPSYFVLVEWKGEPLAVALIVPNLFDKVHDLGGRPSIAGWARLAWRLLNSRFVTARVILLGVVKRLRGTALGALLPSLVIAELIRRCISLRFDYVEMGWILESNHGMRALIERLSPTPYKRYRLYEMALTPDNDRPPPLERGVGGGVPTALSRPV
jgi:hypothetical protein